ncbi:hypothetical protein Hanom_Chr06g00503611 [Helianthus anomalus]
MSSASIKILGHPFILLSKILRSSLNMSRTGRSSIRSVLTKNDLEIFVDTYQTLEQFSPTLLGPDGPEECTSKRIVLYTPAFSACGVRYPLSAFKVELLKHFGIHFSQLHPLVSMRVVHFVASEPSVPLFCMFYKLVSNGDWFTFTKRKDSISPPCYSFMPTSTYPKEYKNRFIFVSVVMLPESHPLRDPKAPIEDSGPVLSADKIVQWKRMYENPNRAFTFPEGDLAMGGLSALYFVRPKAFFGKKEMTLWGLLQGDCRDIKFRVGDKVNPEMGSVLEKQASGKGGSVHVGGSVAVEKGEKTPSPGESSSEKAEGSRGSLRAKSLSDGDDGEGLKSHLLHKRKADQAGGLKAGKPFDATKAASEIPHAGAKSSLSKDLRSSSLASEPFLGTSKAPIVIPPAPASSRVKDKAPEISVARVNPAFDISPLWATGTSKPSQPEYLFPRSPLAPLFAKALSVPYVLKWKITPSIVVGTPEATRDFLDHVVPPPHKFMNFTLNPDLFYDQYRCPFAKGF